MATAIEPDPVKRKAIAAEMNLSVLKRGDTAVRRVIASATHVAMYKLCEYHQQQQQQQQQQQSENHNNNDTLIHAEWERCDIEGSLFLVERDDITSRRYRVVIINRKSLNNYSDDIVIGNKDIELNDQTIMYCNSKQDTVGIWFYQSEEAAHIFTLLTQIAMQMPPFHEQDSLQPSQQQQQQFESSSAPSERREPSPSPSPSPSPPPPPPLQQRNRHPPYQHRQKYQHQHPSRQQRQRHYRNSNNSRQRHYQQPRHINHQHHHHKQTQQHGEGS